MNLDSFKALLREEQPPAGVDGILLALWYDGRGDWDRAHDIVQDIGGREGAWVHAYLHRKEGDPSNAAFWYRQAGRPVDDSALEEEWERLVEAFL